MNVLFEIVSKYGGRASDISIVKDSGFINLFEPSKEIMAEKGFPKVQSEILKRNYDLIMPPLL